MTIRPPHAPPPPHGSAASLLRRYRRGRALEQGFYSSPEVHAQDMKLFLDEWHFAAHVSEIPNPGDYVLFSLLNESVILVRGGDGRIRAFANVCRHRGARVCTEDRGTAKRFTCPYHAWTYNLDGSLFTARLMAKDIDKSALGLKPVAVEVFEGLIFVSFAARPARFAEARKALEPELAPFGLAQTRIAHRARYPVAANWKLLVENYNECYHCAPAHPEFTKAHTAHMDYDRMAPFTEAMTERARGLGIPAGLIDCVGPHAPAGSIDFTVSRHALHEGYVTGSRDGKAAAPLLGSLGGYDGGACDLYIGILNPMLIYNDHAVIYRFIPTGLQSAEQEIIWLVRDDAEEGRDYDLQNLTWLWDVTTLADKKIIELNQAGVNSRYYEPGPLAEMEAFTQRFIDLYISRLAASLA